MMALANPSKLLKVKKRKLKDKIKFLNQEDEKLQRVITQYLNESQKRANTLLNSDNITEFSENYENTLMLLDTYHNDLFSIRLALLEKLEKHFKIPIELDTDSSEEDSYKTVPSRQFSPESTSSLPAKENAATNKFANSTLKNEPPEDNTSADASPETHLKNEPHEDNTSADASPERLQSDSMLNAREPDSNHTQPKEANSSSYPTTPQPQYNNLNSSNDLNLVQVSFINTHHQNHFHRSLSPEERISPNTFVNNVNSILDEPLSFNEDENNYEEVHVAPFSEVAARGATIVEEYQYTVEEVPNDVGETPQLNHASPNNYANYELQSTHQTEFHTSPLNPNAPAFKASFTSLHIESEPLLTESQNLMECDEFVSDLVRDEQNPVPVVTNQTETVTNENTVPKSTEKKVGKKLRAKVTHVNNLVDFYVKFKPDEADRQLSQILSNFRPTHPAKELNETWFYIAVIPQRKPFRAQLISYISGDIARVKNLELGPECTISINHLYDAPSDDIYSIPYAGQCSLYEYNSVPNWNTPELVDTFKAVVCADYVFVRQYREFGLDPLIVDVFLQFNGVKIDVKEYCKVKHTERPQASLVQDSKVRMERPQASLVESKALEAQPIESHASSITQGRDSSSDRSTPESQFDWKAVIDPAYCPPTHGRDSNPVTCFVSYVENPSFFFVHLVLEESGALFLDQLQDDMNEFYNTLQLQEPVYKRAVVQLRSFWCCLKPNDVDGRNWYRVKVLSCVSEGCSSSDSSGTQKSVTKKWKRWNMDPSTILEVMSVDYGSIFRVSLKDLYPLAKSFVQQPALALPCSLRYIAPPKGHDCWPKQSIDNFISFATLDSPRNLKIFQKYSAESNCIVDLFNDKNESARMFLIHSEAATEIIEDPDIALLDNFDPMKTEYTSARNNYATDVDDAGVALTGYRAQDESYICKYYARNGKCYKRSCRYYHIKTSGDCTADKDIQAGRIPLELPAEGIRVLAMISYVYNPGSFYIICPFGVNDASVITKSTGMERVVTFENLGYPDRQKKYDHLSQDLNEYYQTSSFLEDNNLELALSTIVACKFEDTSSWHRAKVTGFTGDNVNVVYLDYGNEACVPRSSVRQIKPQFMNLPQLAIHCVLDNAIPANGSTWTKEAMECFIQKTQEKLLYAKIMRIINNTLYVDLYTSSGEHYINLSNLLVSEGHAKLPRCNSRLNAMFMSDEYRSSSEEEGDYFPG